MASTLNDLLAVLQEEASRLAPVSDGRRPLEEVFEEGLRTALAEIKKGANSSTFPDLVVINFIIAAHGASYQPLEIKAFIEGYLKGQQEGETGEDP